MSYKRLDTLESRRPSSLAQKSGSWCLALPMYTLPAIAYGLAMIPVAVFAYLHFHTAMERVGYCLQKSAFILPCLIVPHYFLKQRTALLVISIVLLSTIPIELGHLLEFNSYISTQATVAILATNLTEALDFTKGREVRFVLCALAMLAWVFTLVKCPNRRLFETAKARRLAAWTTAVALVAIVIQVFYYSGATDYSGKGAKYFIKDHVIKEYPVNGAYRLYEIVLIKIKLDEQARAVARFRFEATSERPANKQEVDVLIIGESGRYENYGFNGYGRNTTPMLSKTENLVVFPDYYSSANSTSVSIPLMLTRGTPRDPKPGREERSIVSLYREAGFTTYWISSHEALTQPATFVYKNEADHFWQVKGQDEAVLPVLKQVLDEPDARKFIVISVRGNHYGRHIYPDAFERFVPGMEGIVGSSIRTANREEFINSYDNSVLYQDFVLSQIIDLVRARDLPSYVWFSPDHGESLFEPPLHLYGHGSPQVPREQIHIPVFVWLSERYIREYQGIFKALLKNRTKRLSAANSFYTLASLGGIRFQLMMPERSVASEMFVEPVRREVYMDGAVIEVH